MTAVFKKHKSRRPLSASRSGVANIGSVWHPCMQMKDFETLPLIQVASAKGDKLVTTDGDVIIDAISSWWCKSLGHGHPRLMQALREQTHHFEHVILANTTFPLIEELSARLCALAAGAEHVFYASEGSSAVEIALKMALHAQQLRGQSQRQQWVALANGYHGETCMALSLSDVGLYRKPYASLLQPVTFLQNLPLVSSRDDARWADCSDDWLHIERQLEPLKNTAAAIIVEPILQGAGGMRMLSADLFRRLRVWCDANHCFLINDEILTGMGRTGKMLAMEHANITADFICLSKGLTGGVMPLSAVLTGEAIYQLFYDDYASGKAFLHSHTYCGNALAVAVANECLQVIDDENIVAGAAALESKLHAHMQRVAKRTGLLTNIRAIGAVVAAELTGLESLARPGFALQQFALACGVLLRPLGNTVYWLPPLNVSDETLVRLEDATVQALEMCRSLSHGGKPKT